MRLPMLIVGLLMTSPAFAAGDEGDPAAGKLVARSVCARCHDVRDDISQPPPRLAGAPPAFATVAQDSAITSERLTKFLRLPHGEMNNILLTTRDTNDVISYVISLRRQ